MPLAIVHWAPFESWLPGSAHHNKSTESAMRHEIKVLAAAMAAMGLTACGETNVRDTSTENAASVSLHFSAA